MEFVQDSNIRSSYFARTDCTTGGVGQPELAYHAGELQLKLCPRYSKPVLSAKPWPVVMIGEYLGMAVLGLIVGFIRMLLIVAKDLIGRRLAFSSHL